MPSFASPTTTAATVVRTTRATPNPHPTTMVELPEPPIVTDLLVSASAAAGRPGVSPPAGCTGPPRPGDPDVSYRVPNLPAQALHTQGAVWATHRRWR